MTASETMLKQSFTIAIKQSKKTLMITNNKLLVD